MPSRGLSLGVLWKSEIIYDEVDVLIAATAEVDEDRLAWVFLGQFHGVGDGVGAFEGGDDAFEAAELVEGVDGFLVVGIDVVHALLAFEHAVLWANSWVVESAGDRVDGRGFALFILQQQALEAVDDAWRTEVHGTGVVACLVGATGWLDSVEGGFAVAEKGGENAHGVAAAADTGEDVIGQLACHFVELLACFDADDALKVAYHHGEGVGSDDGADAVDGVDRVLEVGLECGVDGFLECAKSVTDRDDFRAEDFHAYDVWVLLFDIDLAHMDFALEAEVGGCGSEGDSVLAGSGFGDETLLAHVFGEKGFAHAMVELVGAGVVQVFALEVDASAVGFGKALAIVDRGGASLEVFADAAQLGDEGVRFADVVVGIGDPIHFDLEVGRNEAASEFAELACCIWGGFKIVAHSFFS